MRTRTILEKKRGKDKAKKHYRCTFSLIFFSNFIIFRSYPHIGTSVSVRFCSETGKNVL